MPLYRADRHGKGHGSGCRSILELGVDLEAGVRQFAVQGTVKHLLSKVLLVPQVNGTRTDKTSRLNMLDSAAS